MVEPAEAPPTSGSRQWAQAEIPVSAFSQRIVHDSIGWLVGSEKGPPKRKLHKARPQWIWIAAKSLQHRFVADFDDLECGQSAQLGVVPCE